MTLVKKWTHNNEKEFIASVEYTIATTGFRAELVEKDYFCSVILNHLMTSEPNILVFKGGTLLTKVHTGYFRLSEDLDFSVPIHPDAKRSERRNRVESLKNAFVSIPQVYPEFKINGELKGSNNSKQYNGVVLYKSYFSKTESQILVEISVREQLVEAVHRGLANTLLMNPITGKAAVETFPVLSLSRNEAYAEKIRAALCRREPAIRDFFDLQVALEKGLIDLDEPNLKTLVKTKLVLPEPRIIDVSDARVELLKRQMATHLEPMLRAEDYKKFDLAKIVERMRIFSETVRA